MTSSSDTEFQRRRLFVSGLPTASDLKATEVKAVFEELGPVTHLHLAKGKGHAFVTFEDEDAAGLAIRQPIHVREGRVQVKARTRPISWFDVDSSQLK